MEKETLQSFSLYLQKWGLQIGLVLGLFIVGGMVGVTLTKLKARLPEKEKERILHRYSVWKNLPEPQKQKWQVAQSRFEQYDCKDKAFLGHLHHHWSQIPLHQKKQWERTWKIFHELPLELQEHIKYEAIFLECVSFEMGSLPHPEQIHQCIGDLKSLRKAKLSSPTALRHYIYQHWKTVKVLPWLPPHLQNYWRKLPVENRQKILKKIQQESEKHQRFFLIQLLKQQIQSEQKK
jgi:hypothetical protein